LVRKGIFYFLKNNTSSAKIYYILLQGAPSLAKPDLLVLKAHKGSILKLPTKYFECFY